MTISLNELLTVKWKTLKPRIMYFTRRVVWKTLNTLQLRQKNWSSKLFSSFFSPLSHSPSLTLLPRFDDVVPQNNKRQDWVEVLWFGFFLLFFLFLLFLFSPSFSLTLSDFSCREKKGVEKTCRLPSIYIYTHIFCTHTHTYPLARVRTHVRCVYIYIGIYTHAHIRVRIHIHTHTHERMHTLARTRTQTHTHIYSWIVNVCVCVCACREDPVENLHHKMYSTPERGRGKLLEKVIYNFFSFARGFPLLDSTFQCSSWLLCG